MRILLSIILFSTLLLSLKKANSADKIVGLWELEDKSGKTYFFEFEGKYYGKLIWGKYVVKSDKKTSKKDSKNPNPKLRERNILGITNVLGLTFKNGVYSDGYVYDPTSGKSYNCKMWFEGEKLMFRGYKGISALGKTVVYKRIK